MLYARRDFVLRLFLTSLIGISSYVGDNLVKYGQDPIKCAILDNLTHAAVGGLTWSLILNLSGKSVVRNAFSAIVCFSVSSLIDLDHFLLARSWKLTDATKLDRRPFLHCSTVPIVAWMILTLSSKAFNCIIMSDFAWIILAGFISHHIRDATRRGLWFYPIGATEPIPYYLYIFISMCLPYILHWFMTWNPSASANTMSATEIV